MTDTQQPSGEGQEGSRQTDAQPQAGQGAGGQDDQAHAAADAAAQAAAQAGQGSEEEFVRIPRRNYANLAPDGDFNKVVSLAKRAQELETQMQELQRDGFGDLIQMARAEKLTGHELILALTKEPEERTAAEQAQVEEAAGQVQDQAAQQGDHVTRQQAEQMVEQAYERALARFRSESADSQSASRAQQTETRAIESALDSLELGSKAAKVSFRGSEEELDMARRFARSALLERCQEVLDASLSPRDPDYQRKRDAPFTPEVVKQATTELAPHLKQYLAKPPDGGGEEEDDKQIPAASIAGGQGGRVQKKPEDMTPEEKQAELRRRGKARRDRMEREAAQV